MIKTEVQIFLETKFLTCHLAAAPQATPKTWSRKPLWFLSRTLYYRSSRPSENPQINTETTRPRHTAAIGRSNTLPRAGFVAWPLDRCEDIKPLWHLSSLSFLDQNHSFCLKSSSKCFKLTQWHLQHLI